jgi:hypothetical protein
VEDRDLTGKFVIDVEGTLCDTGWVTQTTADGTSSPSPFVFEPTGGPNGSSCQ